MTELKNMTLWQMICSAALKNPAGEAVVSAEIRLNYSDLVSKSGKLAAAFLKAGIKKGSHIGTLLNDSPETIVILLALWCIGAVPVPLCTSFSLHELENCIKAADIEYMITDRRYRDNDLLALCAEQELIPGDRIFTAEECGCTGFRSISTLIRAGVCTGDELSAAENAVQPTDVDTILFTSGSTGSSKAVLTTHFSRVNTAYAQAAALDTTSEDRFCSVLPTFHCFSLTAVVLAALSAGACLCFPRSRHSADILNTVEKERCTVLTAVPTLFSALIHRQAELHADVSTLRTGMIGGSTYSPALFREACDVFGFRLLPSLGQTEATAGITAGLPTDSIELRSSSLGIPFAGVELRIEDGGKPLPDGKTGEICIRGFNVMQGYYKDAPGTAAAIDREGFLHTGDLGCVKDGYLYYEGRIKNIIIRGGENIFPGEIERVLNADSRIAQVNVVGVPDRHYIEEVCACIIPAEGCSLNKEDVRGIAAAKLSSYKVPGYILFFSAFPLTNTGKIDRCRLSEIAAEKIKDLACDADWIE